MHRFSATLVLLLSACISNQVTPASPRDCEVEGDCEGDTDSSGDTDPSRDTNEPDDTDAVPAGFALRSVQILPDPAHNDDVLYCSADADLPGDGSAALTYLWTRVANGAELGEGDSLDLSLAAAWPPGTTLRCQARLTRGVTELTEATTVVLANRSPVVSMVSFAPPSPRVGDTLRCAGAATDPDGDALSWSYAWSHGATDGEVLITPALGGPGASLTCTATVSDVHGGSDADASSVLIANTPPVVTSVSVSPLTARVGETVACSAEASDADGDLPVLTYAWSNGASGASYTLASSDAPGSSLVCTATASDALDASLTHSLASSAFLVDNTPPVVTSVSVSPLTARVGETVTCSADASDADGDLPVLTYAWSNGASGVSYTLLSSDPPGATLVCTATAADGLDASLTHSLVSTGGVTVENTPPVVTSVSVSPLIARVGETVTCSAEASDADGDLPDLAYAWSNGASGASYTLDSSDAPGATLVCTATAADALDVSLTHSLASADGVLVENTPPVVTSVSVSPPSPARGDEVSCVAEATDDDGDPPSLSYAWSTGAVGPTITVTADEPRGTPLTCTATATDALDDTLTDSDTGTVTVGNTPPVVVHVGIAPTVARTLDTLTVVVEASDADGDLFNVSYVWEVDGEVVADETGSALGPGHFVKGRFVVVKVTADDGEATGVGVSESVVIVNTVPGAPVVKLAPDDAIEGDDLLCSVVMHASDPDVDDGVDELTYGFAWTVDDTPFPAATDDAMHSEVAGEDVSAEDVWVCVVTASDGEEVGPPGLAEVVVAPPITGLRCEDGLVAGCGEIHPRLGVVRYISSGSFVKGCVVGRDDVAGDCPSTELAQRSVQLTKPYWMMESELTQAMWAGLGYAINPSTMVGSDRPVHRLTWWEAVLAANDASAADGLPACYTLTGCTTSMGNGRSCEGIAVTSASGHPKDCTGWRLATEAEWEHAARAGTSLPYSGGSDVDEVAWYNVTTATEGIRSVCTTPTPRNAWGLCDMSGNVWEWTWDYWVESFSSTAVVDPSGPTTGFSRPGRGGSYSLGAASARAGSRRYLAPSTRSVPFGTRLVRTAE